MTDRVALESLFARHDLTDFRWLDARDGCRQPRVARPTPEAFAVDVFSTVRKLGYPIEVLADHRESMNRYAFLMIE